MNKLKVGKGVKLLFLVAVLIAAFVSGIEYFSDAEINKEQPPAATLEQFV